MATSPRETVVAATPCERAPLFTCCRAAAAAALALEAAAEEPEAAAELVVVTAPEEEAEEEEEAAADDQEDDDATEVSGTLVLPTPILSVVVGVPLRMAFWYQGSSKRSGMQLSVSPVISCVYCPVRYDSVEGKRSSSKTHRASQPFC